MAKSNVPFNKESYGFDGDITIQGALTVAGALSLTGAAAVTGIISGKRPIKNAATVLTAADSGAKCYWSAAAGWLYTLPTAAIGLWYDFEALVDCTSVGFKILTASTSEFLLGAFIQGTDGTFTQAAHAANGSTIRSWNGNGTTTGGLAGDFVRVAALSATQWGVIGMGRATGSEATPFATS